MLNRMKLNLSRDRDARFQSCKVARFLVCKLSFETLQCETLKPGAFPTSPTTKECNSRTHKHMRSFKSRCYNRVNQSFYRESSGFSRAPAPAPRRIFGTSAHPAKTAT